MRLIISVENIKKWIKEIEVEGRKRTYRITDKGLTAYEQEVARLQKCVQDASNAMYED